MCGCEYRSMERDSPDTRGLGCQVRSSCAQSSNNTGFDCGTSSLIHAAGGIGGARLILSTRQAGLQESSSILRESAVDTALSFTTNIELNSMPVR